MSSPLISCQTISKSYGSRTLFQDISFGIFPGDKIGVIGPNGSGKSTLFKILARLESPDSGTVSYKRSLRIGYVPQNSSFPDQSLENILMNSFSQHSPSSQPHHIHQLQTKIILSQLGFQDPTQLASSLSGGWKKRLAIAKELVHSPDLILFDEPTNHLDLEGIRWLENFLDQAQFSYLLISHDRYFLQNVTNKMMELDKSYPKGMFFADGPYLEFLEKRDAFLSGQAQYERSLRSKVRREIEWLKQNPKARTTKSTARIKEAGQLISELSDVKTRNKQSTTAIDFASTKRETHKLLVATRLAKSLGGKELFSHVSFTLSPGTRLGIVGGNGSGKTTLLKILAGELEADRGTIKSADNLKIVYFDQERYQLPNDVSLRRALAPVNDMVQYRGQTIHVDGWAKRFMFSPERLNLPVSQLSGGEKARILIARLMAQPADILFLDEPTNDLDIPTLEVLEESLLEFPGAIVLITHDRFLLDQISTAIIGLGLESTSPEQETGLFASYAQLEAFQEEQKALAKEKQVKVALPKEGSASMTQGETKKAASPSGKKMSYKEKMEFEQMESKIHETEALLEKLHQQIEDPEIASNSEKLQLACEEMYAVQANLDRLFERWQELLNLQEGK